MPSSAQNAHSRPARRHTCQRNQDHQVDAQSRLGGGEEGAGHGGGAAHVGPHPVHLGRGLDGDAARVEGDALAHEDHRLLVLD